MPVIQISLSKLAHFCKNTETEEVLLEALPYLGLDIEDQIGDSVKVEYSPNRPDFSSEVGIARALAGLLGHETGPPTYSFPHSKFRINVVGDQIRVARPYVFALYAETLVSDELIKQLITMQEDLHNGMGRKRSKVAIGIHNAEPISTEIKYHAIRDNSFSFVPLGASNQQSIREILGDTSQGITYGRLLSDSYPILEDVNGNVLSMPPIINGELTRLRAGISKLFVDLTGTDIRVVDTATAIMASMLSDVGAKVFTVEIRQDEGSFWSPNLSPKTMHFDLSLTNDITGIEFTLHDAESALGRSRIGLDADSNAVIPRYRHDIIHHIDLVEEVALGYGIQKLQPLSLKTSLVGELDHKLRKQEYFVDLLIGLGLTEVWNLSLTNKEQVSVCEASSLLKVEDTKSANYEYLRCQLMPSLLAVLGASIDQEYPQNIFELAPVFRGSITAVNGVVEEEHVGVALADSTSNYSAAKSIVESFLRTTVTGGFRITYRSASDGHGVFAAGRTAEVALADSTSEEVIGHVGEVAPDRLEVFGLKVPVAGFELRVDGLLKD